MLALPVDEDAWVFRACLYIGMALLVLDVVLPKVFHRRVRMALPWPRAPRRLWLPRAPVMSAERFRRRKRELEAMIRTLENGEDVVMGDTQRGQKKRMQDVSKAKTKRTLASRVVMRGDPVAQEPSTNHTPYVSASRAELEQRPSSSKRVSFDMSRNEKSDGRKVKSRSEYGERPTDNVVQSQSGQREAPTAVSGRPPVSTTFSATNATATTTAAASQGTKPQLPPPPPLQRRTDPFSLVDDDFPWQLPNYAKMSAPTAQPAPYQPVTTATAAEQSSITLNYRRPLSSMNVANTTATSSVSTLAAASALELKHKPLWSRSQRDVSPRQHHVADPHRPPAQPRSQPPPVVAAQSWTSSTQMTRSPNGPSEPGDHLEGRQLDVNRPSPTNRNHVPSPRPPLHRRGKMAGPTSQLRTPVVVQSRLRTPKIIRRITFDEDMMGALATPQEASPIITESNRKRQREKDVMEALDAVSMPWQKRHQSGATGTGGNSRSGESTWFSG